MFDTWRKLPTDFLDRALWWGLKAGLSIVDQAGVSAANLALNIFLVRWLSAEEYGIFGVTFSVFLFFYGFHNALILEPMSVLGPARHGEHLPKYLGSLVWVHVGLTMGMSLVLAIAAFILRIAGSALAGSFLGLSLAIPFILLFWFFRRACYLRIRPDLALRGSFIYAFLLLVGLFFVQSQGCMSSFNAFLLMSLASMGASLVICWSLNVGVREVSLVGVKPGIRAVLTENWGYGKWLVGDALMHWFTNIVYLPLIGIFAGLPEAGVFRAMQNLVRPLQQTLTALGNLLLPRVSEQRAIQGELYVKKTLPKIAALNVSLAGVYVVFLVFGGKWMVEFLYGQDYYVRFLWLLPYLGAIAFVAAAGQVLAIGLKAIERPNAVFWSKTAGALLTLTVGLSLVWSSGLYGAAVGSVLTTLLMTAVLSYFLWDWMKSVR